MEGEGQDVQQEAHQVDGQAEQHTLRLLQVVLINGSHLCIYLRECDGPQEGDQEYAVVNHQGLPRWQVHYTALHCTLQQLHSRDG